MDALRKIQHMNLFPGSCLVAQAFSCFIEGPRFRLQLFLPDPQSFPTNPRPLLRFSALIETLHAQGAESADEVNSIMRL